MAEGLKMQHVHVGPAGEVWTVNNSERRVGSLHKLNLLGINGETVAWFSACADCEWNTDVMNDRLAAFRELEVHRGWINAD